MKRGLLMLVNDNERREVKGEGAGPKYEKAVEKEE
jgi:hypothetical protein